MIKCGGDVAQYFVITCLYCERVELCVLVYKKYECFVMQMLYVCVLCASCGSFQLLHSA